MSATIDSLIEKCQCIEDEFTQYLGFKLPKNMTREVALELLTAIDEPLKSDIKRKLITSSYAVSKYDYRWLFLNSVIKFSIRFGKLDEYAKTLEQHFIEVLEELEIKVYNLLHNGNFNPTMFTYLRQIINSLSYNLDGDVHRTDIALINVDNFPNLAPSLKDSYLKNDALVGISEQIGQIAKRFEGSSDGYCDGTLNIRSCMRYIETEEDLVRFKEDFLRFSIFLKVFNQILDKIS